MDPLKYLVSSFSPFASSRPVDNRSEIKSHHAPYQIQINDPPAESGALSLSHVLFIGWLVAACWCGNAGPFQPRGQLERFTMRSILKDNSRHKTRLYKEHGAGRLLCLTSGPRAKNIGTLSCFTFRNFDSHLHPHEMMDPADTTSSADNSDSSQPGFLNGLKEEPVTCEVGKKTRAIGKAFINSKGIYTEFVCNNGIKYRPGDTVYLESSCRRDPFETYNICEIHEFYRNKRDGCLHVKVIGFSRLSDIPEVEFQHIVASRNGSSDSTSEEVVRDPAIQNREVIRISHLCDVYPVTALRGLNHVTFCRTNTVKDFVPGPDRFFWTYSKTPASGLASTQGEIRVGSDHQAKLPKCQPDLAPEMMTEKNPEECMWRPKEVGYDMHVFIQAIQSMNASWTLCNLPSMDDAEYVCQDGTTQKALDTLHKCNYSVTDAIHTLLSNVDQLTSPKKWNEDDEKRFVKGIRQYGKNFFRIRKELLSHRKTAELIEFYYLWKKTPAAQKVLRRPRRQTNVVRRMRGRPNRALSSDYVDLSPYSDEERESDDSEKDLTNYQCSNCNTTESKDWHPTTKDKTTVLCGDCRLFYKKYGELRPTEDRENAKPVTEETNSDSNAATNSKNGPTTRRGNNNAGRPRSAGGATSPETAEKGRKSPGTASSGSASPGHAGTEGKSNKRARGKSGSTAKEIEESPEASQPSSPRKRQKTNNTENSEESLVLNEKSSEKPPSLSTVAESVPSGDKVVEQPVKVEHPIPVSKAPIAPVSEVTCGPRAPVDLSLHQSSAFTSLNNVAPVQIAPAVKEEPKEPAVSAPVVKAEPPVDASIKKESKEAETGVKPEQKIKQEKRAKSKDKDAVVKVEPLEVTDENERPGNDVEPKPEHSEISFGKFTFNKIWNRGPSNSCGRTDLTFKPAPGSALAKKREAAANVPSTSSTTPSSSSNTKAIKSPVPVKDGKRTPASSNPPERDPRAGSALPGLRITETPPRHPLSRLPSVPGLSPQIQDSVMHPHFGQMPNAAANMFYQDRLRMMEMERAERERMMMRSVQPGMMQGMPQGPSPMEAHLMEMQRLQNLSMFGAQPPPGHAMALLGAEQAQQRQMAEAMAAMGAMGMLPPGAGPHPHALQQMQQEQQMRDAAIMSMMNGGAPPFGRPPFPGPMPGGPGSEMMHPFGRPPANLFEEQQMMAAQAQQQAVARHMEAEHLSRLFQMSGQGGHPDMFR